MFKLFYWLLTSVLCSYIDLTRIPSTNPPPEARLYQAMDYDPNTDSLITFGGATSPAHKFNDIWQYSFNTSLWNHLEETSSAAPDARMSPAVFIDETTGIFYMFGGSSDSGPQNDLWAFAITTMKWSVVKTTGSPEPRSSMGYTKYIDSSGILYFAVYAGKGLTGILNTLEILDTSLMKWSLMPNNGDAPSFVLYSPNIQYYDGYLYMAGGDDYINSIYNVYFYRYDLANKKWEDISNPTDTYTTRNLGSSFIYNDEFYLMYGWSDDLQADASEVFKVSLKDPDFKWSVVNVVGNDDPAMIPRDSYGFALNGNAFYVFGGYCAEGNLNDVVKFEVSENSISYTSLALTNLSPSARSYHTMETIEGFLYIFGGVYKGTKLNDLWKFDPETETWESISSKGVVPPARSHHSSGAQGNVMFIFGGIDISGQYLDDLYQFDVTSNTWKLISPSTTNIPSSRYGACAVYSIPILYIYGGYTISAISNELWTYDSGSNTYKLLSTDAPYTLFFPRCAIDTSGTSLIVMGGKSDGDMPVSDIFSYSISDNAWKILKIPSDWFRNMGEGVVVYIKDFIIFLGGEQWGTDIKDYVYAIDMANNFTYIDYPPLPVHIFSAAYSYYKTDIYIHGGGLATGIFMRNSVPVNTFYKVKVTQLCDNTACPAICSPGTHISNDGCTACPVGRYNNEFNQSSCVECPEGTYNPSIGCNNRRECFPCQEGEYNNIVGQSICKKCPIHYFCPTGSSEPSDSSAVILSTSSQPKAYQSDSSSVNTINNNYLYSCLAIFGLVTVLVAWSKDFRNKLRGLDQYDENHNIGEDIVLRKSKNRFGGYFTIGYLIGASWFIFANISNFVWNNVNETKALLPLVAVEDQVTNFLGDVTLVSSFIRYGGKCVDDNGDCLSEIKVSTTNIKSKGYSVSCVMDKSNNCIITFICDECEILTGAEVNFELAESLSFTSAILVNVTSSSSIPGAFSNEEIGLSSSTNKVLRGYDPSIFSFSMVPSLFRSEVSNWPSNLTGYHVEITENPTLGSEYYTYELPFSSNLNLRVILYKSTNCLSTVRSANQTWLVLLSALLGAVFGWKDTVQGVMSAIEKKLVYAKEKISKKFEFAKRAFKTKHLVDIFDLKRNKKSDPVFNLIELDKSELHGKTYDKIHTGR